ncbi:LOW QUALITY PROTEIN: RAS guanyl-releasing protein 4-like [Discoglossus pictus]
MPHCPGDMHRKDSKRKSRLEFPGHPPLSNGVTSVVKSRPRQTRRRRMTCPSPAEINTALITVTLAQLGKGCTLQELMEKCVQSFDPTGKLWRDEETVHMVLVMHSWLVPSAEFAEKLLQLYPSRYEETGWRRRLQICHLLRFWSSHYPEVFRIDDKLEAMMSSFWESVKEAGGQRPQHLMETSEVFDREISRKVQQSPSFNKKRKVSLLFDHLEPKELADHISYLEFKCFCRISHLDYRSYTLQSSLREIPHLERSVNLCNCISQWVQLMILNRPTPQQRAEVFAKFIRVTQNLRKLQNFNTLMAVIGGLCHSAISRLKETHSYLSHDVLKILSEMTELLSSSSNYSTYRRAYNESQGFKIPILGVQLKDLVSLNEALPDYLDDGKINVSKLQSLYQHILELRQLQNMTPPFQANKDLVLLLTSSLDLFHTEDDIYDLSYTREPRIHKSVPTAPDKTPEEIKVSQWTPEVSPQLDPETLSRNIEQMVDCVFKFYDRDHQGYVSLEDFEKVVASLPFSCHDLEKDRQGPISRQEMTAYFIKASRICAKLGFGFLQSLVETRIKKSPLCTNCVWAVANQMYVCGGLDRDIMLSWSTEPMNPGSPRADSTSQIERHQKATQTEAHPQEERPVYHLSAESAKHLKPSCGDNIAKSSSSHRHLSELEKEKDHLMLENAVLHSVNSELSAENARLLSHICSLKDDLQALSLESTMQPTITRILETLGSLHLQSDGNM